MHRLLCVLIASFGLLLAASGVGYWLGGRSAKSEPPQGLPMRPMEPLVTERGRESTVFSQSKSIAHAFEEVNRETDPSGKEAAIRRLSEEVLHMPKASAVREILAFLNSVRDA